jgi:hypothetical protein
MKKMISVTTVSALLLAAMPVFAANNGVGAQGMGTQQGTTPPVQQKLQASPSPAGYQVQNINQVQIQNEGEDSQLRVNTQEEESLGANTETEGRGLPKEISPRSETATQHMSIVAQKVEALLADTTMQGGIGQQVKVIAQEQKMAQVQLRTELEKVDDRGGLLKSIVGPDFKALKNMQQEVEQNQLRIEQLTLLQNQLTNQADIDQVQEMIRVLTEQNISLQDRVSLEEQSGSMLGWLFKLFAK